MQFLKNKNKTAISIIGLTGLVISFSLWLADSDFQPGSSSTSTALEKQQTNQANYFMEDFNIISTDIKGKAQQWLSGELLQHLPNGNTYLTQPLLQLKQKQQHWLLSAKQGTIKDDKQNHAQQSQQHAKNKTLTLHGNVNIQQLNKGTKTLTIQTEHLDIVMAKNIATTRSKIKLSDENGVINAVGLELDFDTQQLRLLSQVKGRYEFQ